MVGFLTLKATHLPDENMRKKTKQKLGKCFSIFKWDTIIIPQEFSSPKSLVMKESYPSTPIYIYIYI